MFNSTPISVTLCLQSEGSLLEYSLEVFRAVNEKYGGFDLIPFPKFFTHYFGDSCRDRKQLQMTDFAGLWINSGVQPELLIVDSNHCFVDSDLIRNCAADGL